MTQLYEEDIISKRRGPRKKRHTDGVFNINVSAVALYITHNISSATMQE
ncbi:MAG: hypothetical protein OXC46_07925 [Thaumarchaeota archaeon]|nr:hypothetical protein [Nitrososphaerota archaeon]